MVHREVVTAKSRDLSLFYLFLAIQECIDLAAHWVADEGWGEPDDAGSAFDVLADRKVIDRDAATASRAAAGLRNRIAHGYALLDSVTTCSRKGATTCDSFAQFSSSQPSRLRR